MEKTKKMQSKIKKILCFSLSLLCLLSMLLFMVGCNSSKINVISRDAASGTRATFDSFIGVDKVRKDASYLNSNGMILSCINKDKRAIGYVANKSFEDSRKSFPNVKTIQIDGESADSVNYKLGHSLNLIYKEEIVESNATLKYFLKFLKSKEAIQIIVNEKYLSLQEEATSKNFALPDKALTEKIIIGGSTTVEPLMQILREKFIQLLGDKWQGDIEIQGGGSSKGIADVKKGMFQLGMASRELKESEKEGVIFETLANENIVVIVNVANSVDNLTREQLQWIYEGKITEWTKIK